MKHPLISHVVELGSFKLSRSGETDLAPPRGGDERHVGNLSVEILTTLLERAVYFDPTPPPPTVGIF